MRAVSTQATERTAVASGVPVARRRGQGLRSAFALLALDLALLNLGFLTAYFLRYELRLAPEISEFYDAPLQAYLPAEAALTATLLVSFYGRGLYRQRRARQWLDEVGGFFGGTTVGIAVLSVLYFVLRPGVYSRMMFAWAWLCIIVLLSAGRLAVRWHAQRQRRLGIGLEPALVVGAGHVGRMVMQQLAARPGFGYRLVGFLDDVCYAQGSDFGRFRVLGSVRDLPRVLEESGITEVVVALPSASHRQILEIMRHCATCGVGFKLVPDLFELSLGTVEFDTLAGIPLIGLRNSAIVGANRLLKRGMDVLLAGLGLLVFAPVMAVIAVAIRLESPGPTLVGQWRVGKGGRLFRCYKFRSMYQNAEAMRATLADCNEATGPLFKIRNDPRVTRVGRIIRRRSMDELPQLWNIVKGDMSVVGPRPPFPQEVEQYEEWHKKRLEVTPGLTGLWQVSGRSDLAFDEMVVYDVYYIENWSLALDLKILLQTVPAVLTMRGAY